MFLGRIGQELTHGGISVTGITEVFPIRSFTEYCFEAIGFFIVSNHSFLSSMRIPVLLPQHQRFSASILVPSSIFFQLIFGIFFVSISSHQ